jgi:hypothetical protein
MTEAEAIQYVMARCEANDAPQVSDTDIRDIVQTRARYGARTASAPVNAGQRIAPGNGRVYRCFIAGTTAAGTDGDPAPVFPTGRYAVSGYRLKDGSVYWEDAGPAHAKNYDLNGALHDAWMLKAARTAKLMNVANGPDKTNLSERHEHCKAMAAQYAPLVMG